MKFVTTIGKKHPKKIVKTLLEIINDEFKSTPVKLNPVVNGEVIDKEYEPWYERLGIDFECTYRNGKSTIWKCLNDN